MRPFLIHLSEIIYTNMKNLLRNILVLAGIALFAASCQYKFIVEPVVPPPDPTDTISFSQQIVPIFSDQNCTACHNGGQTPDLTPDNAYNSITNTGLVDTNDPPASKIYYYPLPDESHYAKYTSSQAALVLQWIEQGALDN